jgi:hypothetical protein
MFNLKNLKIMSRKLIKQGAKVGSKVVGGLLFLSLLTGCGATPKAATKNTLNVKNLEAYQKAVEKMGGFGVCQGDCLLGEAAAESRKGITDPNTKFKRNSGGEVEGYKLVEEIDGKPLVTALMSRTILKQTEEGQKKGSKPKKDLVLKEGISGAYEQFVKVVLEDASTKKETRHAKLLVLVEGLKFVRNMANTLTEYDDATASSVKTEFTAQIAKAEAGVYAIVNGNVDVWPPIEFLEDATEIQSVDKKTVNKKDKANYKLTAKSKEAAEALIKVVEEAVEEYKKEKDAK